MSIRNQYAKNHYKIAPLVPSSTQLANARNAVRRRNIYRASTDPDDTNKTSPTKTGARNTFDFTNLKTAKETTDLFTVRNGEKIYIGNNVPIHAKQGQNHHTNVTNKLLGNNNNKPERGAAKITQNKGSKKDVSPLQNAGGNSDVRQSRPMSARPVSRWERRDGDDIDIDTAYISDDDIDTSIKSEDSLSYRDSKHFSPETKTDVTPQSRPKTGHGRKQNTDTIMYKTEQKQGVKTKEFERPKSRRAKSRKEASSEETESNKSKSVKQSNGIQVLSIEDENDSVFSSDFDYHIGISTFYPDARGKIHGIDDINLQIEDIDQNVDPVLFFMDESYNNTHKLTDKKKTSLSKDAINFITNEKSSRQNKPAIGFQGNNQNKRNSIPESTDRFHSNYVLSPNSIAEDNQRCIDKRHDRIKSDSLVCNLAQSRDNAHTSRAAIVDVEWYPSSRVLKNRNEDIKKPSTNEGAITSRHKVGTVINSKPRKLKPLTSSYLEE